MKTFWRKLWYLLAFLDMLAWIHAVATDSNQAAAFSAGEAACMAMARTYEEKPCTPTAP